MGLLEGLLGAGASIWSTANQARVARENTDKTILANKEMAQYAYSKDLEMWERANAYNSPEAQMLRLKQANLNPMLVYGTGSVSGNTTGNLPKYNAPEMQYNYKPSLDPLAILGAFQDLELRQAQRDNIKEQTKSKQLENQVSGATLVEMINKIKAESSSAVAKDNLDRIKLWIEDAFWGPDKTDVKQSGQYKMKIQELSKSEGDAQKALMDVMLKEWDLRFKKALGPAWGNILRAISLMK